MVHKVINFLQSRGYSRRFLKKEINRVRNIPRQETLKPRPQNNDSVQTPFVITYTPALPNVSTVIRKNVNILQSSTRCKYTFSVTKEERRITDSLSCKSKNLIYLIECKKCGKQYIGETKRQLNERFGEHRRSILNHNQIINPTPISEHFNQPGHSINDVLLIPLELIHNNRDSVRKAREAHLIDKAMTLEPRGINRRDELN